MPDEIVMDKAPMSQSEIEKVEREKNSIRLMFIIYIVLSVIFCGMIVFGAYINNIILIVMGALPVVVYLVTSILFLAPYSRLKKDLQENMKFTETGVIDDVYVTYGKGQRYRYRMNGKTRRGFREMIGDLKKGDKIELYLACNSKVAVGYKKIS